MRIKENPKTISAKPALTMRAAALYTLILLSERGSTIQSELELLQLTKTKRNALNIESADPRVNSWVFSL